jgi:hypothetical protein
MFRMNEPRDDDGDENDRERGEEEPTAKAGRSLRGWRVDHRSVELRSSSEAAQSGTLSGALPYK